MDKQYFMLFAVDVIEVSGIIGILKDLQKVTLLIKSSAISTLSLLYSNQSRIECFVQTACNAQEVVKLLTDNDCSVNICDTDGQTPLHWACEKEDPDIAELLLKRNSNIRPYHIYFSV
jgi:ankyrin repeat protein